MKSLSQNLKQKHLNCKVQKGKFVSKNARSIYPSHTSGVFGKDRGSVEGTTE